MKNTTEMIDDNELKIEGYRESLYSNPFMDYLVNLYITAIECGCFGKVRHEAEEKIIEILDQNYGTRNSYYD